MKKSKFLKKSLAMLLALMLVVAMIPLSASAATTLPNMDMLYVNGSPVTVDGSNVFSDEIYFRQDYVTLRLNQAFTDAKLYVLKKDSTTEGTEVTNGAPGNTLGSPNYFDFDTYAQENTEDAVTLKLELVANDDPENKEEYTVTLSKKTSHVTASLASGAPVKDTGVYAVEVNNASQTVNVIAARGYTNGTPTSGARITVTGADGATISGTNTATLGVKDGDKFTVKSESGDNDAEYTIKVTVMDALQSFSIAGVEGVITDEDKNDTPDTVTVTLPKSAVLDEYKEAVEDPKLPVEFATYGNTAQISIHNVADASSPSNIPAAKVDPQVVKNGESAFFGKLTVGGVLTPMAADTTRDDLRMTCEGVEQKYDLVIKFAADTTTAINYAQLNKQVATIEGNNITAELPNTPGVLNDVEVTLRTPASVDGVLIDGKEPDSKTDPDANDELTWTWTSSTGSNAINLGTSKIITVTAENGDIGYYNLSATVASNTTVARLTAVYLTNGDVKYEGQITDHTITFNNVPYMTTDIAGWKVYATPVAGANATGVKTTDGKDHADTDKVVVNGTTKAVNLWDSNRDSKVPLSAQGNKGTTTVGKIAAVNKTTPSVEEIYNVVVNLTTAKTGKTLSKLNITAQPDNTDHDTDKEVFRAIDKTNTVVGDISETNSTTGKIVLNVPFSLYDKASTPDNNYTVIDYAGDNGGVVFGIQYENTGVEYIVFPITATVNDDKVSTPVTGSHISPEYDDNDGTSNNTPTNRNVFDRIIVLPEETARKVLTSATGYILSDADSKEGTIYTVENNQNAASHAASMTSMSIGNFNFTVTSKMNTSNQMEYTISGTLPWSLTTDNGDSTASGYTPDGANATFFDFEISPYAEMGSFDTTGAESPVVFFPNGDSNNDGEEDAIVEGSGDFENFKLVFERNADHTVTVYHSGSRNTTEIDGLLVKAEDRLDTGATKTVNKYYFDLKWAEPNTTADITAFSIGNSRGTIDNSNDKSRTINVTVPFGTDLKGLIPTFTASSGAKVRLNSSTTGTELQSGKTAVNFSHPVKLYVTSEDTKLTVEYTVTVNAAAQFSDVQPGAWYYDNVMRAVELGILSGYTDGTFRPMNNITRRDFAIMLAQAMGNSNDGEAVSPFIDVADDDYGVVSIAFLYEKQITVGDDQGKFNPDSYITRQEAAIFLAKAFGATGTSTETFKDDAKIASWAKSFVYAAKAAGLMNGDTDGKFRPNDTLTRAEAASAMVNAVDK